MNVDTIGWWGHSLSASPWPIQAMVIVGLALLAGVLVWGLITLQAKSCGHKFSRDYWPLIKQDPRCVTAWRLGIVFASVWLVTSLFGRFM